MPTGTVKRIVCLANSRKRGGSCIAGKELVEDGRPGDWVRPVSARASEEVSHREQRYDDGTAPRVLDVLDVPILNALPKNYQQENWLLDPANHWNRVQKLELNELDKYTDHVDQLWTNGSSTNEGFNDEIPGNIAMTLRYSLCLVRVNDLTLSVIIQPRSWGRDRRRVQGRFHYGGVEYWLWVTALDYEERYSAMPQNEYSIGDAFLTVSLGEPFRGNSYKLIAAIIEPN